MPVQSCNEKGKPGYKYGESGACYTYSQGDEAGRKKAKQKAFIQGAAIAARTGEKMEKEDASVFDDILEEVVNTEKAFDKFVDDGEGLIIEYPEDTKKGIDVGDVHVATPSWQKKKPEDMTKEELAECKKAKKRAEGCPKVKKSVPVMKMDEEQRLIYGIVLVPDVEDLQGDICSKEDIQAACHDYLVNSRLIKAQHRAPTDAEVVECYIAPVDIQIGKGIVPEGSWVMVTKVHSNAMWEAVKKGDITGYSIGGRGTREEI
jgi:hypothetical protein